MSRGSSDVLILVLRVFVCAFVSRLGPICISVEVGTLARVARRTAVA